MEKIIKLLMVFILGMLAGASLIMFRIAPDYEKQLTEQSNLIEELRGQITSLETEVKKWEKQDKERQKSRQTIQDVIVVVGNSDKMSLLELEVAKKVKKDMEWMIGKPTESLVEIQLGIHRLLNNKKYEIDNRKVSVKLNTLVIQKNVHLYLSADVEN